MRRGCFLLIMLLATPALAQQQQQPDLASMQRIAVQLQAQRNAALDAAAVAEARAAGLAEEVEKLKAQLAKKDEPKAETPK